MSGKRPFSIIACVAFLGGYALMAVEIIYPRISAIWFGNILDVWAVDLAMSLFILALGYRAGSYLLAKNKNALYNYLLLAYFLASSLFFFLPHFYVTLLDAFLDLPVISGAILFAFIFMIPTIGVLAATAPLWVEIISKKSKNGPSLMYGISSLGGAVAMLLAGLYTLPNWGIRSNCYLLGGLLFINILLTGYIRKSRNANPSQIKPD